jgi:hypothetical protein
MKSSLIPTSLFLLFIFSILQQSSGQTIAPALTTDWTNAGYRGNIDANATALDVTTLGIIGDSITDNSTALNAAISAAAGNRTILFFPAGNYLFNSPIQLNDSIVLRGACSDSTHFQFNFNGSSGYCISGSGSNTATSFPVNSGYQKDNNFVVVADSGYFGTGDWAEIQQDNGTWDTQPISWADNSIGQLIEITGRNGDTIFFNKPLRITFDGTLNVRISKINPIREVVLECFSYERIDSVSCFCPTINFRYAVDCMVRGIEGKRSISAHVLLDASSNITVTGSYFHDAFEYNGSSMHGYGVALYYHTGQCLIENNIMRKLRHSFSFQCGANGNVTAYNYSLEPNRSEFPSNYGADISMHGHYPFSNLFEGNIVQNIQLDQTWGPSGPYNTFFRNRAELYGILMSSGTVNSDLQNFVGNEVTSTAFLQGNYTITGAGHFQFGNNIRGTITPTGTGTMTDSSYYLSAAPDYWITGTTWPSIGPGTSLNSGTIAAKERFNSSRKTVCGNESTTTLPEISSSRKLFTLYPNPNSGRFLLTTSSPSTSMNVVVADTYGRIVFQSNLKSGEIIDLGKTPGVYILSITTENRTENVRLVIQ